MFILNICICACCSHCLQAEKLSVDIACYYNVCLRMTSLQKKYRHDTQNMRDCVYKKPSLIDSYRDHMVHFQALTVKKLLKLTKEKAYLCL